VSRSVPAWTIRPAGGDGWHARFRMMRAGGITQNEVAARNRCDHLPARSCRHGSTPVESSTRALNLQIAALKRCVRSRGSARRANPFGGDRRGSPDRMRTLRATATDTPAVSAGGHAARSGARNASPVAGSGIRPPGTPTRPCHDEVTSGLGAGNGAGGGDGGRGANGITRRNGATEAQKFDGPQHPESLLPQSKELARQNLLKQSTEDSGVFPIRSRCRSIKRASRLTVSPPN